MAIMSNGFLVKTPSCDEPPKYSLLSSVEPLTVSDPHWFGAGIEFEDSMCGDGVEAFIDLCPPVSGFTKPTESNMQFCSAEPFVAIGSYQCSPVGRPANEAFEIARKRLLIWESRQVEEVLWTGTVANGGGSINPSFSEGNSTCDIAPVDINEAGALDPVAALGLLESELGDVVACGGVIHVPYRLLAYLAHFDLVSEMDGVYYTPTGFKLIAGHGYPGSGPNNAAASTGEVWIFGTGPVVLVRSNVFMVPDQVNESVDRNVNNLTVRAERIYTAGFSCALLAIRVSLCDLC